MCYSIGSVLFVILGGYKVCGISAPWPGIELTPPALEGEVLTTGPLGKSHRVLFY